MQFGIERGKLNAECECQLQPTRATESEGCDTEHQTNIDALDAAKPVASAVTLIRLAPLSLSCASSSLTACTPHRDSIGNAVRTADRAESNAAAGKAAVQRELRVLGTSSANVASVRSSSATSAASLCRLSASFISTTCGEQ